MTEEEGGGERTGAHRYTGNVFVLDQLPPEWCGRGDFDGSMCGIM
jgi:hypothetical protein